MMGRGFRILTKAEESILQEKLQTEYLTGVWTTYHQAALRHGLPDTVIGKLMRRVKIGLDDTFRIQREEETTRTLLQIETTIGKAFEAYETSRRRIRQCKTCSGLGETKDGDECILCNGEGYIKTTVAGDSKYLIVVLKALEQKAKIYAMYPERKTMKFEQYNVIQGNELVGEQNILMGASTELLLRANRLMLELKGEKVSGNGEILDVESKEKKEE